VDSIIVGIRSTDYKIPSVNSIKCCKYIYTVKPVFSGHHWEKEKVAL
jgi:hypothetical protein